jgi:hypothetical protein
VEDLLKMFDSVRETAEVLSKLEEGEGAGSTNVDREKLQSFYRTMVWHAERSLNNGPALETLRKATLEAWPRLKADKELTGEQREALDAFMETSQDPELFRLFMKEMYLPELRNKDHSPSWGEVSGRRHQPSSLSGSSLSPLSSL